MFCTGLYHIFYDKYSTNIIKHLREACTIHGSVSFTNMATVCVVKVKANGPNSS